MAVHKITRGLDLPLAGAPSRGVENAPPPRRVALVAADFVGLKPTILVEPGAPVKLGQPLLEDKSNPGVRFTSPGTGRVAAVNRGERRALQSVVVELDRGPGGEAQAELAAWSGRPLAELDGEGVRALLLESGLWTALRTRPFSRVPPPDGEPRSIFVTAIDTHPHAPPVELALEGREADFGIGLEVLQKLTPGKVYLCRATDSKVGGAPGGRVAVEEFAGPHPAGTPGLHIHLLDPVDHGRTVWHVGYQDVAAMGHLFRTGRIDPSRTVALCGPVALRPRLLRTRLGASTDELTLGEGLPGEHRVISGSVLDGRTAMGPETGYLGRYHRQVSMLAEGHEREMFGWIAPGAEKFSIWGVVLGAWRRGHRFALTTSTNGSPRAMVPIGAYERVMPMDILPTFLLRALITQDIERAETLGCLELDEEDLALCTCVCPGKYEYGPMLRDMLSRIQKEG